MVVYSGRQACCVLKVRLSMVSTLASSRHIWQLGWHCEGGKSLELCLTPLYPLTDARGLLKYERGLQSQRDFRCVGEAPAPSKPAAKLTTGRPVLSNEDHC